MSFSAITDFLNTPSEQPKVLVIFGPTACGKTSASIQIAKKIGGSVINADSRQIYRGMDIGTGKITPDEMEDIPHYLLDIKNMDEDYSVGQWQKEATAAIEDILQQNRVPILCGGTGLYLDSLIYNLTFKELPPDWEYRAELESIRSEKGNEYLWNMLHEKDPEYAQTLHPNNYRYVMRGIEVLEKTGVSKSAHTQEEALYDFLFISPYNQDREALYAVIEKRVDAMFEQGFVDEVESLLAQGYSSRDFGMKTLGYKEICQYLQDSSASYEELVAEVQKGHRRYAKRQCTWFGKYFQQFDVLLYSDSE